MASYVTEHPAPLDLSLIAHCLHRRLIDEVLTADGKPTGQVRCLECCLVFEDPDQDPRQA
jgi:hypothetical protein